MKKSILILAALVAPSMSVAQDGARPVSLQEAIELGRRNAPGMINARGQQRTSAMALRRAKWALYNPFTNLGFNYGSNIGGGGSYNADGIFLERNPSSWGFSQSFGGFSLTLWDGGVKLSEIQRQKLAIEQAENNEVTQRFSIAANIKTQYYLILQAIEQEGAALAQIAQAEQQHRAAVARVRAGTAIASDSMTTTVSLGNARVALTTARNNRNNASAQLTRLTASDFPVTAIMSDTTDPAVLQINETELIALADAGPAVRNAVVAVGTAKTQERTANAIRWPTITMGASYGRSNSEPTRGGFTGYDFGAGRMGYSWGFNLNMNYVLFNNWQRESNQLNARVGLDNAEANLREARLLARQNITQQLNNLRTAEANLVIARTNLLAASEALRVQTLRYEVGAGNLVDMLSAQTQYNNTRNTLIQQRFNLRNIRAAIESLNGRELPQ
jgi:outer membrane protein